MIVEGVPFSTTGEAYRFSVLGHLRASIRITADDASTGAIEIRRAWGTNAVAAYTPAQTIQINGSEPVDLIVDDCSELVIWVTTAGSGQFDIEYILDTPVLDTIQRVHRSLEGIGTVWESPTANAGLDRVTIVAETDIANTKGAVELRAAIDIDGQATAVGSITLDGSPTSFTLPARSRIGLYCSAVNANLAAEFTIYRIETPQAKGVDELELPDTVAYTDQAQQWTFLQQFDNFNITGSGSGRTRITSAATAGEQVDLPALSGDIPIITDTSPATNELMFRQGSGGYASRVIEWSDIAAKYAGTSFPGSPSDGDPFYRTDLDMPELFHYDATRGKWLGELRSWYFTRSTAASSGYLSLGFGQIVTNTSRGLLTPSALTIVGAEFFNGGAFSGSADLEIWEGSTSLSTLLSINDRGEHDHSLNYDLDADAGWPQKHPRITNITSGTITNPVVAIHLRRRES